jgi:hypothetical protein
MRASAIVAAQRATTDHRESRKAMNPPNRPRIAEEELAALNARAEASLAYDDDAWDDAVRAAEDDCASLCESLLSCTSGEFE